MRRILCTVMVVLAALLLAAGCADVLQEVAKIQANPVRESGLLTTERGFIVEEPVVISGSLSLVIVEMKAGDVLSRVGAIVSLADGFKKGDQVSLRYLEVYNNRMWPYTDIRIAEQIECAAFCPRL